MNSELVSINPGLQGELYRSGKRPAQLVIICHGYKSSRRNPTLVSIAEQLQAGGRDVFCFDFSKNFASFDIEHQVNDIMLVAEHFANYEKIVLLGHSFGALTTAIAAAKIERVQALITLNGFFGRAALGQRYRGGYSKFRVAALAVPKYRAIYNYYQQQLQPQRLTMPVLVIHSPDDKDVFIRQSREFFAEVATPKVFFELNGADHGVLADNDRLRVVQQIQSWLQTH